MPLPVVILLCVLGAIVLFFIIPTVVVALRVHQVVLTRTNKTKWTRKCTFPEIEGQVDMYNEGIKWMNENINFKKDVSVVNDSLKLAGEYFDFGNSKAVILIQGRAETLHYAYYFAQNFRELGYNVLVIDGRAHGLSEGRYNSAGLRECYDLLAWTRLLHDKYNNEKILYFGICIGSATALYATVSKEAPDYIEGIIAEGMFTTFRETFRTHTIAMNRPAFPVVDEVMIIMSLIARRSMYRQCPVKLIKKLNVPILMLCGKEDTFSTPDKAEYLYNLCPSKKEIVWFDKGPHAHLRYYNTEKYDAAISDFVRKNFN